MTFKINAKLSLVIAAVFGFAMGIEQFNIPSDVQVTNCKTATTRDISGRSIFNSNALS
jgi:hypothetical protein